jgi:hypothetical protein
MIEARTWFFDRLAAFNNRYFGNVINLGDIDGVEIAIKNPLTKMHDYFFVAIKNKEQYLIPSKYKDKLGTECDTMKIMPIRPTTIEKVAYRSKAYLKVRSFDKIKLGPEQTLTFRQMVDSFCSYDHEEPDQFLLWKLTAITAHVDRINVRIMTMPGWAKDSVLTCLKLLFGDGTTVNKPSIAKLKYLISNFSSVNDDVFTSPFLGLNEVQDLKPEDVEFLARFYEDVGDFKPFLTTSLFIDFRDDLMTSI